MTKISPSILSADFTRLGEQIAQAEAAGADYIHIDVMDGHFVPNITVGPLVVQAVRSATSLPLDVHLMIEKPEDYIQDFRAAGADIITIHFEASRHAHRLIQQIRQSGARAGVSLNPATSLSSLEEIAGEVDMIVLMSVNPGFGGQSFIPEVLGKVARLRPMLDAFPVPPELEVDGGVNAGNIRQLVERGADVLVAGSAVFNNRDTVANNMHKLRASLIR